MRKDIIDYLNGLSKLCYKEYDFYEGDNILLTIFTGRYKNLHLYSEQIDFLLEHCDLKETTEKGVNALMYILTYNSYYQLNINQRQWDYLLANSCLKQLSVHNWSAISIALLTNKSHNLQLNSCQWDYLIEHSNLLQEKEDYPLFFALSGFESQNIKNELKKTHWQELINKTLHKNNFQLEKLEKFIFQIILYKKEYNIDMLSIIWPHFNDKDWFIDLVVYLSENKKSDCNYLDILNCCEFSSYKESQLLGNEIKVIENKNIYKL